MAKIINHKHVSILSKVKETYNNCYPSDTMGNDLNKNLTFVQLLADMQRGEDFYKLIGVSDSIVRERIFTLLAVVGGIKYDDIYCMWLNAEDLQKQYLSILF